jgi:hypothetical protein
MTPKIELTSIALYVVASTDSLQSINLVMRQMKPNELILSGRTPKQGYAQRLRVSSIEKNAFMTISSSQCLLCAEGQLPGILQHSSSLIF